MMQSREDDFMNSDSGEGRGQILGNGFHRTCQSIDGGSEKVTSEFGCLPGFRLGKWVMMRPYSLEESGSRLSVEKAMGQLCVC